jgi:4'-phosphopantetheinyl transferase
MESAAAVAPHRRTIHLWFAFLEDTEDARLLADYRQLLTAAERRQESLFHFHKDRRRYLVTRALARVVLSRFAAKAPDQLRFNTNEYGKPAVADLDPDVAGLSFNLSHTGNLIVLAVAHDCALGVDTESVTAKPACTDLADRFFTKDEAAALRALPSGMQQERFFEYWTLKEAYIKARGMGLAIALDRFGFHFPSSERVSMWMHPDLGDCPSRWRFWQLRAATEYLIAVCAEQHEAAPSFDITTRRIVPLRGEETISCTQLRASRPHSIDVCSPPCPGSNEYADRGIAIE